MTFIRPIARTDPVTEVPTCATFVVDGVRLQVHLHIAEPRSWTAYVARWLIDVTVEAAEHDQAQTKALVLLEATRSELRRQAASQPRRASAERWSSTVRSTSSSQTDTW